MKELSILDEADWAEQVIIPAEGRRTLTLDGEF